jgi:hypothetical protein
MAGTCKVCGGLVHRGTCAQAMGSGRPARHDDGPREVVERLIPTIPTVIPTRNAQVVGIAGTLKLSETERVKAWREKNREKDNARRAEYNRARRARGRADG